MVGVPLRFVREVEQVNLSAGVPLLCQQWHCTARLLAEQWHTGTDLGQWP
jgi:hypothetical protein